MFTLKEILALILALIVLAFSVSFMRGWNAFAFALLFFAIILLVNVIAKKLMAYYLEAGIETKIWTFKRFGLHEKSYFKTPIPLGIILAFLLPIISGGFLKWFAVTESEIVPLKARAAKRHDFYSFSELTEKHIGKIATAGIVSNLVLALIAYLINQPELGKLSIYFACFNMPPISKLDGSKIFFGSITKWFILAAICLIALSYALFLI